MTVEMKEVDVFKIPVLKFKYDEAEKYKSEWVEYLDNYDKYSNFKDSPNLKMTEPTLHKDKIFNPLRAFMTQCLYQYIRHCNMNLDIGITSMWGTKQPDDGYHHSHTHGNTFAVGVYYLHTDSEKAPGTRFNNVLNDFLLIRSSMIPEVTDSMRKNNKTSMYSAYHELPFEEGTLVLFPGWLRHDTTQFSGKNRYVISLNSMPIGMTDQEPYDRYNFPNPKDMKLFKE